PRTDSASPTVVPAFDAARIHGIRDACADDALWLVSSVDQYVRETGDRTPTVICSTASAYKFPQAVGEAIGCEPAADGFDALVKLNEMTGVEVPYGLRDLDKRAVRHSEVIPIGEMEEKVKQPLG
ncbi:MAG: hypothetical protein IKX81_00005, partial [Firmicutes bacterium]|nr:hypothetical protein [Bacillota bacterium]